MKNSPSLTAAICSLSLTIPTFVACKTESRPPVEIQEVQTSFHVFVQELTDIRKEQDALKKMAKKEDLSPGEIQYIVMKRTLLNSRVSEVAAMDEVRQQQFIQKNDPEKAGHVLSTPASMPASEITMSQEVQGQVQDTRTVLLQSLDQDIQTVEDRLKGSKLRASLAEGSVQTRKTSESEANLQKEEQKSLRILEDTAQPSRIKTPNYRQN